MPSKFRLVVHKGGVKSKKSQKEILNGIRRFTPLIIYDSTMLRFTYVWKLKSIVTFNFVWLFAVGSQSEVRKSEVSDPGYGEYTIFD